MGEIIDFNAVKKRGQRKLSGYKLESNNPFRKAQTTKNYSGFKMDGFDYSDDFVSYSDVPVHHFESGQEKLSYMVELVQSDLGIKDSEYALSIVLILLNTCNIYNQSDFIIELGFSQNVAGELLDLVALGEYMYEND